MYIKEKIKILSSAVGDGECLYVGTLVRQEPRTIKESFCAFSNTKEDGSGIDIFSSLGETEEAALANLFNDAKKYFCIELSHAEDNICYHNKMIDELIIKKHKIKELFDKIDPKGIS